MANASIFHINERLKTLLVNKNTLSKLLPILLRGNHVRIIRTLVSLIQKNNHKVPIAYNY